MTVAELIGLLQALPANMLVYRKDAEWGDQLVEHVLEERVFGGEATDYDYVQAVRIS
jgi:hypothetical protein